MGKWLNGYGSQDAHGEVPKGFDIWRALLDVSAYDYHNFVMNSNGKIRACGDADFARKLVEFSEIQVTPPAGKGVRRHPGEAAARSSGRAPTPTGAPRTRGLLLRRHRPDHQQAGEAAGKSKNPFFIWWSPAAPHREDVAVTLMGRPGPDPRPPARYDALSKSFKLPQPPSFNETDIERQALDPDEQGPADDARRRSTSSSSTTRGGSGRCAPSTTTSASS